MHVCASHIVAKIFAVTPIFLYPESVDWRQHLITTIADKILATIECVPPPIIVPP